MGPNVDVSKTNTLFELFTGDGIIQGVFLENGEIHEISHCTNGKVRILLGKGGPLKVWCLPNRQHFGLFSRESTNGVYVHLDIR